ncbi:MAG: glycosyltransferase [Bacteroidetes bacterium]|nr:glycosyltransferase [Bacteroidota bacterium]
MEASSGDVNAASSGEGLRLCVQWPRFGPYHLARLRAVHRFLAARGGDLVGLETAGREATYAWRQEDAATAFRREQVFPESQFEAIDPRRMHRGVVAALDRLQPDAVAINSYSLPDARAALWWARQHRRVAILMSDSKADDAPRSAWREALKQQIVQAFDAALVAGTPQRAYYASLGLPEACIFTGYDVVDNAFFAEGAARARQHPEAVRHLPGLADDTPFFLASNRFIPRKNLGTLLRAYAAYRQRATQPWRLVLLGDGPERARLEALAADVAGVTFAGFRQVEELPAYYGLAAVFVHPARRDQWGLVVNEAMASGLPVLVSTGAGCAHDLVQDGENGFRFDPEDPEALAELMRRMASAEADLDAMGQRSRQIIRRWSPEVFAERLWAAVQAGQSRADRSLSGGAWLVLGGLRLAARPHARWRPSTASRRDEARATWPRSPTARARHAASRPPGGRSRPGPRRRSVLHSRRWSRFGRGWTCTRCGGRTAPRACPACRPRAATTAGSCRGPECGRRR